MIVYRRTVGDLAARLIAGLALAALAGGCASPPDVKQASARQLELLAELDRAVRAFEEGRLAELESGEGQMLEVGRVRVARAAIAAAAPNERDVGRADDVFDVQRAQVALWIDHAMEEQVIADALSRYTKELQECDAELATLAALQGPEADAAAAKVAALKVRRSVIEANRQDWDDRRISFGEELKDSGMSKPPGVRGAEDEAIEGRQSSRRVRLLVLRELTFLREQIGLMTSFAGTVDQWLGIDVTVSQEQADELRASLLGAIQAIQAERQPTTRPSAAPAPTPDS